MERRNLLKNFRRKPKDNPTTIVQTARTQQTKFSLLDQYSPMMTTQLRLYDTLREGIPIIDAAILKIIRLIGGYQLTCDNKQAEKALNQFAQTVKVGGVSIGLESFVSTYLDNLLMYGNAVGEIVLDKNKQQIMGLYNANLNDVSLQQGKNPMEVSVLTKGDGEQLMPVKYSDFVLFTALNPCAGSLYGNSILKGLRFVSSILLKIFESLSSNFERMGNLRYAVTYKPSNDSMDKAYAKERAMQIAKEWSDGMMATKSGQVTDFISVGDVSIKVIGADNQMIDTNIPVRQMLEQIVAKLGIPPFLLGLSWSTTERMSKQQSDILTSELEYYRRLLTPIPLKICRTFLRLNGYCDEPEITWNVINLQDEAEQARASLYQAQADHIKHNLNINIEERRNRN